MKNLLIKEFRLSASVLSYLFILFGLMFFLPGYPVLCGAFFVSMGIFQSFRNMGETNDILFSALLPIAKKDVVKGKFLFVCLIEFCGVALMGACTAVRMTALRTVPAYVNNTLMNANPFAVGTALLIFGLFNLIFVGGFFRTSQRVGRPFLCFIAAALLTIATAEALHHFPGLAFLNAFGTDCLSAQLLLLLCGVILFALLTGISYSLSCRNFEKTDL